eukprot:gnl/Ergobibamus_cyprinoides/1697.p1 GENE.gnl/Ergobibamus_cyprinoides/1697~~gnl/Ergobibamus_cyprinoides/1697.p1  ORF type:complete len:151 (-),score=10.03 gnl/Ergobibamus_cyprinoides/1697:46-498(-)
MEALSEGGELPGHGLVELVGDSAGEKLVLVIRSDTDVAPVGLEVYCARLAERLLVDAEREAKDVLHIVERVFAESLQSTAQRHGWQVVKARLGPSELLVDDGGEPCVDEDTVINAEPQDLPDESKLGLPRRGGRSSRTRCTPRHRSRHRE